MTKPTWRAYFAAVVPDFETGPRAGNWQMPLLTCCRRSMKGLLTMMQKLAAVAAAAPFDDKSRAVGGWVGGGT